MGAALDAAGLDAAAVSVEAGDGVLILRSAAQASGPQVVVLRADRRLLVDRRWRRHHLPVLPATVLLVADPEQQAVFALCPAMVHTAVEPLIRALPARHECAIREAGHVQAQLETRAPMSKEQL